MNTVDTMDKLGRYVEQSQGVVNGVLTERFIIDHPSQAAALWAVQDRLADIHELASALFKQVKV